MLWGMDMLKLDQVSFSYKRKPVLQQLSLTAEAGECIVLAGPNGSGKSTLLSLIAGVRKPDSGRILREGKLGYVPQGTALFEDMTVEDNLRFFARLAGAALPEALPLGVDRWRKTRVSRLSGGTAKRVSIACALLGQPDILLLDEPAAGLDLIYQEELLALLTQLKAQGLLILYAGHEIGEFADLYDRLLFLGGKTPQLFDQRQLSGTAGDAYTRQEALAEAYRSLCHSCLTMKE